MPHLNATHRSLPALLQHWANSLLRKARHDAWRGLKAIERDQPLRFVCPDDVEVTCVSGTAWITMAADTRDIVLEPGDTHAAARRERLFINAMPRCVLRIEPVAVQ
jgi:hypothetical protein